MPVRIKPTYDLGTCKLRLDGIEGIIDKNVVWEKSKGRLRNTGLSLDDWIQKQVG